MRVRRAAAAPLTRIANRIAKSNSGQSDLSPRGEECAGAKSLLPSGRRWPEGPDEGALLSIRPKSR
ncbi:hypothetical protein FJW08_18220 [Mesorhizobium sp. B3-2-1]|nr:hypothetical protein FJW08_18220 [Mesorhizobium sp. B3-2-1]